MSIISNILDNNNIQASLAQADEFGKWLVKEAWNAYKEYKMNQRTVIENKIQDLGLRLPNGTVNKVYSEKLAIPKDLVKDCHIEGCDALGLTAVTSLEGEEYECVISGKPTQAGDYRLSLCYKYNGWLEGDKESVHTIPVAFNPDPRSLWNNIPTNDNIPYYKHDSAVDYVKVVATEGTWPRKNIVAASQRGRSHAHEGNARDDHFRIYHCDESDWYIIAVADGAGSARFSRKGSQVACDSVVDTCKEKLMDCTDFEEKIRAYKNADDEQKARKTMADTIYDIIAKAAFKAQKDIFDLVNAPAHKDLNTVTNDFATTLMFAICKKFDFGWFVASFWVGDGAICIYNKEKQTLKMLGTPDEGEFSGQTRFLTMREIFQDPKEVMGRLRFSIEDDFTALMLMTDGVSDPMFETLNNLNSIDKWNELWDKLKNGFPDDNIGGVDLSDDNEEAKNQLLSWLDFWSSGNNDDRTIAILY